MNRFEGVTRPLMWLMALFLASFVAGCHINDNDDDSIAETTAPTVSFTFPANASTGIALNTSISATFSEALKPSTVTASTFTLMQGASSVPGAVTYSGTTAVFNPTSALAASTVYTATITTGVRDLAGNALATARTWSFTTGTTTDTTAPTVSSTTPLNAASGTAINASISVIFSETMDPLTVTASTFTLMQGATPVPGSVTYSGSTAIFKPASTLAINTIYTATITTGVMDLSGNALAAAKTWSFTTGTTPDGTVPIVSSTTPANSATGVATGGNIAVIFSEPMDPLSFTTATFTLMQGATSVPGTVTYVGNTATFNPASTLAASTVYTATISTKVLDQAGNAMTAARTWSFTTGTVPDTTAPTVSSTVPANSATGVAIGGNIAVVFSETMNPATVSTATFTLMQGASSVPGTVTYVGNTATFNPASTLAASTVYTATVSTGVKDLSGNAMAAARTWSFTTGTAPDTTAPTVSSTVPANSATGVALGGNIAVVFSETMNPATVTTATFTLMQGTTPVTGAVTYVGTTATFNPTSTLAASTVYTATVSTGVKDLAGNAMAAAKTWSFTTGTAPDTNAPTVVSSIPANSSTDVAIGGNITVTFSESMDPATVTTATFTLMQGATPVTGAVTYVGTTATFNPTSTLAATTVYTATVSTGVKDLAGNAMAAAKTWSFTTGTAPDTTAPIVSSNVPMNAASGVAANANITATFSEAMDPATITTATMSLMQGATPVTGAVTYAGTTATFNPGSDLAASSVYTATVSTGVKDLAGNALATNKTWSFTTGAAVALGPDPVVLGLAGNYAILAETLISATPTAGTAVTGDVGISPAAATFIQGFSLTLDPSGCFSTPTPSTLVTGKLYAADYNTNGCPTPANLTTAIGDMMIAYTDAAGRTTPDHTELGAGDISGLTLAPGLYKWGTGVSINTDVTLNGGPNDVWIFQIAGNLTQANGTIVHLTGGALPKNIFWQVGGGVGVAIGTTAHMEGVILATKAISMATGASINGRLLAQSAVTLDSNVVTQPAP